MNTQFEYENRKDIIVLGVSFKSFASACKSLNIPRQQSLREYRKTKFTNQHEVDDFFKSLIIHYKSEKYTAIKKQWSRFRDGRSAPIKYGNALFKSRTALASHLNCRANPFKVRLAFLEEQGLPLNTSNIDLCAKPFHYQNQEIKTNISRTIRCLEIKQLITIKDTQIMKLLSEESFLSLPMTNLSQIFGINYESLKRQMYDLKTNKTHTPIDVLNCISTLNPKKPIIAFNNATYPSLFSLLISNNLKVDKASILKLLTGFNGDLEIKKTNQKIGSEVHK